MNAEREDREKGEELSRKIEWVIDHLPLDSTMDYFCKQIPGEEGEEKRGNTGVGK